MELLLQQCKLTPQVRNLFHKAINDGKSKFKEVTSLIPNTITKKHVSPLQHDIINNEIRNSVDLNKDLNLEVIPTKSGNHEYIYVRDNNRNISIVICRLPASRKIFTPSKYRGEFSSTNFDKLIQLGIPEELIVDSDYQPSLNFPEENIHFGIIIFYDPNKEIIYEGALKPSQHDWIYKEKIIYTPLENLIPTEKVIKTNINNENEIPLKFHNIFESDEDIEINLKI